MQSKRNKTVLSVVRVKLRIFGSKNMYVTLEITIETSIQVVLKFAMIFQKLAIVFLTIHIFIIF